MHTWAGRAPRHPDWQLKRRSNAGSRSTPPLDGFFFIYAGVAAAWLAWLVFTESFAFGWWGIAFFVVFWLVLAYLVLPRLHRILTIYVPDYFIGRARTSDGLLGDPVNLALDGDGSRCTPALALRVDARR